MQPGWHGLIVDQREEMLLGGLSMNPFFQMFDVFLDYEKVCKFSSFVIDPSVFKRSTVALNETVVGTHIMTD